MDCFDCRKPWKVGDMDEGNWTFVLSPCGHGIHLKCLETRTVNHHKKYQCPCLKEFEFSSAIRILANFDEYDAFARRYSKDQDDYEEKKYLVEMSSDPEYIKSLMPCCPTLQPDEPSCINCHKPKGHIIDDCYYDFFARDIKVSRKGPRIKFHVTFRIPQGRFKRPSQVYYAMKKEMDKSLTRIFLNSKLAFNTKFMEPVFRAMISVLFFDDCCRVCGSFAHFNQNHPDQNIISGFCCFPPNHGLPYEWNCLIQQLFINFGRYSDGIRAPAEEAGYSAYSQTGIFLASPGDPNVVFQTSRLSKLMQRMFDEKTRLGLMDQNQQQLQPSAQGQVEAAEAST